MNQHVLTRNGNTRRAYILMNLYPTEYCFQIYLQLHSIKYQQRISIKRKLLFKKQFLIDIVFLYLHDYQIKKCFSTTSHSDYNDPSIETISSLKQNQYLPLYYP